MKGSPPRFLSSQCGFTLSELLIALAILGVIAVFTIPKVLQAQQESRYNAIAKEAAAMISGAYDAYRLEHPGSRWAGPADLSPYMNYTRVDATSEVDLYFDLSLPAIPVPCNTPGFTCLALHNGAVLYYVEDGYFCDTANTAFSFYLDPNGVLDTSQAQPGSIIFLLYANGRLTTIKNILENTGAGGAANGVCDGTYTAFPDSPPWFDWD